MTLREEPLDALAAQKAVKSLIGQGLIQNLSDAQLQVLRHVAARYDSDTLQTVARTVSEFMGTASRTPNTSDRRRELLNTLMNLQTHGLTVWDEASIAAMLATVHHEGRLTFEVRALPGGWVQVRGRLNVGD